jgi:hypothetical protein
MEYNSEAFWKKLAPGEIGEDQDGNPIVGRTWVRRVESWSSRPPGAFVIQRVAGGVAGRDPGVVYIVRSPSHDTDVYKVGLTRRTANERAREISSSTGVPLPFGVLASWSVGDCSAVEREVHRRLDRQRLSTRREFFAVSLAEIVLVVERVISELELGQ